MTRAANCFATTDEETTPAARRLRRQRLQRRCEETVHRGQESMCACQACPAKKAQCDLSLSNLLENKSYIVCLSPVCPNRTAFYRRLHDIVKIHSFSTNPI